MSATEPRYCPISTLHRKPRQGTGSKGRARATVTRRPCTIAGFYRYTVEEELPGHSPARTSVVRGWTTSLTPPRSNCSWRMSGIISLAVRVGCSDDAPSQGRPPVDAVGSAVLSTWPVPVGHETMAVPPGLAAGPVMRADDGLGSGRSGRTHTIPSLKPAEPIPNAALKRSMFTSASRAVISTS
jgi:hypothetical protein